MGGFDVINWFEKIVMHQMFLKHCKKRAMTGFVIGAESDTLFIRTHKINKVLFVIIVLAKSKYM